MQLEQVFGIFESLIYFKAVVVNLHDFVPVAAQVIGQNVPWLESPPALRASDNAERHAEQSYGCILFFECCNLCLLSITLHEVTNLESNVESSTFGLQVLNDGSR